MIELPPVPSWDGLHPLVIHFPIALLMVAPLFVLAAMFLAPRRGRPMMVAALVLMILGTASTFVAVSTGEAAGKLAERSPEINAVLEHHEELAETTRLVFVGLTAVFAAMLVVPRFFRRELDRVPAVLLSAVFLLFYAAGTVVLVNTAHNGGRLVHDLGVRALLPPSPPAASGDADD